MRYERFSRRQLIAMTWWNRPRLRHLDGIICDGAVRSGKTVAMSVGFLLWSMTCFHGQTFGICGKTIESLRRNVITQLPDWVGGVLTISEKRSENRLVVTDGSGRCNTYYLFGGRDESSAALIQGITLAGVLLDEVALMPRSFVEQACARCSVEGSKLWFNCNPEGPEHWFYKNWIQKARQQRMLRLHFTMDDNLSLSAEVRQRYERLYTGVFYRRFILGQWCVASGLVYEFDSAFVVEQLPTAGRYFISVDYGTVNPFSAGLWCVDEAGNAVRVREYYFNSREEHRQKTDAEYYDALLELASGVEVEAVVVDPSAASFIELIRRDGKFFVKRARNDVLNGIRLVSTLLKSGQLRIGSSCKDAIREFGLYCWDEKSPEDKPLKTNDHAMDDIRYFASTILKKMLPPQNLEHKGSSDEI